MTITTTSKSPTNPPPDQAAVIGCLNTITNQTKTSTTMSNIIELIAAQIKQEPGYGKNYVIADEFDYGSDRVSFEDPYYHNGLNRQTIMLDDKPIGVLFERERNFLCPLLCSCHTYNSSTDEELTFVSVSALEQYAQAHLDEIDLSLLD